MLQRAILILFLCLLPLSVLSAEMTQREWMEQLVAGLGWEYGLPDEPQDEDYIGLLSGVRRLRLEAESAHRKSDRVAVKRYTNYGAYSGDGWVSGSRQPITLHLDLLLRHAGIYTLTVASRGPGLKVALGGKTFITGGTDRFERHELGSLTLAAGQTTAEITLPPNGGIDYFELNAPALHRVAPLAGWQPSQPVGAADLALTTLQLLDLLDILPPANTNHQIELETFAAGAVHISSARHLGQPSAFAWLRGGNRPVELNIPLQVPRDSCYLLSLRANGQQPLQVSLADYFSKSIRFGQLLNTRELGNYCLPKDVLALKIQMPARAGVDMFELREYDTSSGSLAQLLGLSSGQQLPDQQIVNQLLELLAGMIR